MMMNPLIILGHLHCDTSNTNIATMMKEDNNNEPFGSSVVSKLPPVLGVTTNTVSSIDTNEHSYMMVSHAPPLDMWCHTDIK